MKVRKIPEIKWCDIIDPEEFFEYMPPPKDALFRWLTKWHVEETRGSIDKVLHITIDQKRYYDIMVVAPTPEHEFYTLVTMGMSAEPMPLPPTKLPTHQHAELYMHLPTEWKLDADSLSLQEWSWPLAWLVFIANYPHKKRKWIGWGSYMEYSGKKNCMGDTDFSGCMLSTALGECPELEWLELNPLQQIVFYNLLPLYKEEIAKLKQLSGCGDVSRLEDLFVVNQLNGPVNTRRKNVLTNATY